MALACRRPWRKALGRRCQERSERPPPNQEGRTPPSPKEAERENATTLGDAKRLSPPNEATLEADADQGGKRYAAVVQSGRHEAASNQGGTKRPPPTEEEGETPPPPKEEGKGRRRPRRKGKAAGHGGSQEAAAH